MKRWKDQRTEGRSTETTRERRLGVVVEGNNGISEKFTLDFRATQKIFSKTGIWKQLANSKPA